MTLGQHRQRQWQVVEGEGAGDAQVRQGRVAGEALGAVAHQFLGPLLQGHVVRHQQAVAPGDGGVAGRFEGAEPVAAEAYLLPGADSLFLRGAGELHPYGAFVDGEQGFLGELAHAEAGAQCLHEAVFALHP